MTARNMFLLSTESENLIVSVLISIVFLLLFLILGFTQRKIPGKPGDGGGVGIKNARAAMVTFGGLPLLAYVCSSCAWTFKDPIAVARSVFLYVVVLLPASLFILFIATRRESLFNQYVTNLDRLGLLRRRQLRLPNGQTNGQKIALVEDNLRLTRRVKSYLDRFSAVYGTLPTSTVATFIAKSQVENEILPVDAGSLTGDSLSSFELKTVLPVFVASALIALGWMMVLPPFPLIGAVGDAIKLESVYPSEGAWYFWGAEPILSPVAFAFLGPYFFSLQMLIKRFMRRDLGPNAYNSVSMRLILATLGVWVAVQCYDFSGGTLTSSRSKSELLILSFAVGAFPLIVWQLVGNALKKISWTTIVLPNLEGTQALSSIDGLSVWHEARLEEEDIENCPNLASADIVDLMLNTKISPNRIVDWVDQALLIVVLPPKPKDGQKVWVSDILAEYGIRTASSLVAATLSDTTVFPDGSRAQIMSLASAVKLYPNYMLIQNWLAVEPYYAVEEAKVVKTIVASRITSEAIHPTA